MTKLEIYGGLPCSGKTTIINNLKDQSYIHVSSKFFRPDNYDELTGQEAFDVAINAWESALMMVTECLNNNDNVIFESAGYNIERMRPLIKLADETNYYFIACKISECKRRSEKNGCGWVGDKRVEDILLKLRTELPKFKSIVDNFYIVHNEQEDSLQSSVDKIDEIRGDHGEISTKESSS